MLQPAPTPGQGPVMNLRIETKNPLRGIFRVISQKNKNAYFKHCIGQTLNPVHDLTRRSFAQSARQSVCELFRTL
ncbi:hypothetical protein EMIT0P176_40288 [Pseudomonas sp. IT-P176]